MNKNTNENRKDRSDDPLGNLPSADKKKIICWLSRYGFAALLRKSALLRLRASASKLTTTQSGDSTPNLPEELRRSRLEMIEKFRDLAAPIESEPAPYTIIAREQIEKHFMDLSIDPFQTRKRSWVGQAPRPVPVGRLPRSISTRPAKLLP
jgi:hypothetical protein